MSDEIRVGLRAIEEHDLPAVAEFLHETLNRRLSPWTWQRALRTPWPDPGPDHGYLLVRAGRVVGVYAVFRSRREVDGVVHDVCNLAAWCVLAEYRAHGLRLLRALTVRGDVVLTDLSPSGAVVALDERLGFARLDTSGGVLANLRTGRRRGVRVVTDAEAIDGLLGARDRRIHRDHLGALAARHVVLTDGERHCYVVYRRVRRKRLPWFAALLYVSDRELFALFGDHFFRHLLVRHAIPFTILERRIVGALPPGTVGLRSPRPKLVKGPLDARALQDDLYSELACVPW